jgi:hypothetical protein
MSSIATATLAAVVMVGGRPPAQVVRWGFGLPHGLTRAMRRCPGEPNTLSFDIKDFRNAARCKRELEHDVLERVEQAERRIAQPDHTQHTDTRSELEQDRSDCPHLRGAFPRWRPGSPWRH